MILLQCPLWRCSGKRTYWSCEIPLCLMAEKHDVFPCSMYPVKIHLLNET